MIVSEKKEYAEPKSIITNIIVLVLQEYFEKSLCFRFDKERNKTVRTSVVTF